MKRVLTAVVLVPLVLLILFKAPDWLFSSFIGLIAVLAVHEYFGIAIRYQRSLHVYAIEVALGLYFLGHALHGISAFGAQGFGSTFEQWTVFLTSFRVLPLILLAAGLAFQELREALPAAAISYFAFLYIGYTLGEVSLTGHFRNGRLLIFIFLVTVWSGDIFAYYVGKSIGRHKFAPVVSPKKTWEGTIASTVGAVLVSIVLFHYLPQISKALVHLDAIPSSSVLYAGAPVYGTSWLLAAFFGLCVNITAQLGDLVESALKRGAGVKDSGTLLPGHGGILDRIDAMLLACPVLWFFSTSILNALNHHP
jgi:phosphatidate cytidylyltransferase